MHLLTCMDAIQEQWAVFWRFCRRHGVAFGTPCGLFAGRSVVPVAQAHPPYWRASPATRQVVFSGYHLNATTMPAYLGELRRRRLPWLHGYPSLLALVAAFICDTSFDLGYAPRAVTTSSETLLPQQQRLIEQAFGVVPRRHYGNTEAVASISECEAGGLHVDEDFAAVELVPCETGFELVGTTLWNPVMPLVRYRTGDVVGRETTCTCGRAGRIVDAIDGRIESYVVLRDGTRLGRMDHLFKDLVNVREAQIYQPREGEIVFRVVRGARFGRADEELLVREAVKRIGERASIAVEYHDELVRENGSKLRFVVSELDRPHPAATTL